MKTLLRAFVVLVLGVLSSHAVEWQPFRAQVTRVLEALNFQGTPLIYINGREFEAQGGDFSAELDEWIKLELDLLGPSSGAALPTPPPAPASPPSASASAKPTGTVLEKK